MAKKLTIRQRRVAGPPGPQGESAYEEWAAENDGASWSEWLAFLKGPRGPKGSRGPRGFVGVGGAQGAPGPAGPAAEATPKNTTIVRGADGRIQSVAVQGGSTWSLSRDVDGAVASIEDPETRVNVSRDPDGSVSGTVIEEL